MPEARLIPLTEALEAYETDWSRLAAARGNAFVSPEWMRAWLAQYGAETTAYVAVVDDEAGELLGLMPFELTSGRFGQGARIAGANLADYLHPVATVEDEAVVAKAAVGALAREQTGWSTLVLDNVDADSRWWAQPLPGPKGTVLRCRERTPAVLPFTPLPDEGGLEAYLAGRSGSFRRRVRRLRRDLDAAGRVELRPARDEKDLSADMATFFRLHFGRWEDRGGSSLAGGQAQAFHEAFAAEALRTGSLRLLTLEVDGQPIASFYGWRFGDRFAFYQSGFDESWGQFSVGLLLQALVIEEAIGEGALEYDMMLGAEPYKFRFCDSTRRATTAVLTRPRHPAGGLVAADLAARRLAKRLPDGLRARLSGFERRLPTGRRR
jgi:CelD/BcsL family acetyltransferase involved in cellulose biosynthesis